MLLSVIVINYKTFDLTSVCLKSLIALFEDKISKSVELIAVDNGSGSQEVKKLQKLRDELGFKLLTSETNFGFAAGCNMGAEISEGNVLLFLNSDTRSHKGIFDMLSLLNEDPKIGVLGGKILRPSGDVEKSSGQFLNIWNLFLMLFFGERISLTRFAPKNFSKVDWVSGGFMMVKRESFEKVEGFDEDYFMYLEDMDICSRLKKIGIDSYYYPNASLVHLAHGSSSREFAIINIYKSLDTFYKKNKSNLEYRIARLLLKSKAKTAYLYGKVAGRSDLVSTYSNVLSAI